VEKRTCPKGRGKWEVRKSSQGLVKEEKVIQMIGSRLKKGKKSSKEGRWSGTEEGGRSEKRRNLNAKKGISPHACGGKAWMRKGSLEET